MSGTDRAHAVYVMWADDEPLYAGMTCNWDRRLRQHKVMSPKAPNYIYGGWPERVTHVDVWELDCSRDDALRIEAETIRALDPIHNFQHSPRVAADRGAWVEFSEWLDAYNAPFDVANRWATEPDALARFVPIAKAAGYWREGTPQAS